jgi:hypothetical protein
MQQDALARDAAAQQRDAAARAAATRLAKGQAFMGFLGQQGAFESQQVQVKAPDPTKIGYIYDWSSIFANPQQQQLFASPFAQGGEVDTDELLSYLRG